MVHGSIRLLQDLRALSSVAEITDVLNRWAQVEPRLESPFLHGLRGQYLFKLGDLKAAAAHLKRALELCEQATEVAARILSHVLRPMSLPSNEEKRKWALLLADCLTQLEDWGDLIDVLRPILEIEPDNRNVLYGLAQALFLSGQNIEAEPLYRRYIQTAAVDDPNLSISYFQLGQSLWSRGTAEGGAFDEESFRCFERAMEVDPRITDYVRQHVELIRNSDEVDDVAKIEARFGYLLA